MAACLDVVYEGGVKAEPNDHDSSSDSEPQSKTSKRSRAASGKGSRQSSKKGGGASRKPRKLTSNTIPGKYSTFGLLPETCQIVKECLFNQQSHDMLPRMPLDPRRTTCESSLQKWGRPSAMHLP